MTPDEAVLTQAGRRLEHLDKPEYEVRARQTRLVASTRQPSFGTEGVVREASTALRGYEQDSRWSDVLAAGWRIALIDLSRICAVQPAVFTDVEIPDVEPDDFDALADITLQPPTEVSLDTQFDRERKAWIVPSASPNFRVATEFRTDVEEGVVRLGFEIRLYGSFVQAYRYRDRFVLRDGYHRAVALLSRGISIVPALVSESLVADPTQVRRGMLPQEAVFGRHPPMLPDYLDDEVSAEVWLPAVRRMIVIQALDLQPYG